MIYQTVQGTDVPALGFGTYKLLGDACERGVQHALELGYRHIDTAQAYGNEQFVGAALAASAVPREEIFLTTKVPPENFARDVARQSTLESLNKLRTDYLDLLLLHWPNPEVPLAETLGALMELREQGAVRHIGVSNFPSSLVDEAQSYAPIFANQVEYHPYLGQETLLRQARDEDYLLTAYSPVARGKVLSDETLLEIGEAHGKSPAQVALRWLIQQDHVAAIPKANSEKNRVSNFEIFDFELSEGEMARIFALERGERLVSPAWAPAWDD